MFASTFKVQINERGDKVVVIFVKQSLILIQQFFFTKDKKIRKEKDLKVIGDHFSFVENIEFNIFRDVDDFIYVFYRKTQKDAYIFQNETLWNKKDGDDLANSIIPNLYFNSTSEKKANQFIIYHNFTEKVSYNLYHDVS